MNKKMYVDVTEVCEDWGGVAEHKDIRLLSSSMIACLPLIRILLFCPVRKTESFMRRTVMAW